MYKCTHFHVSFGVVNFAVCAFSFVPQSMNFKRSYYANGGLRVKKRKLGCVEHVDEGDDVLAGITAWVKYCL